MGHRYFVSMFADASFCEESGTIGWAVWARNDERVKKWSGVEKTSRPDASSNYAEAVAVFKGVARVIEEFKPDSIHVVTDSLAVIDVIKRPSRNIPRDPKAWQLQFQDQLFELLKGKRITAKHVKGHNGQETPRKWVNRWCDIEARKQMRKARGG